MSDTAFWARTDRSQPEVYLGIGPCWLWTGTVSTVRGVPMYGQVRRGGKVFYAHRYAWEDVNGPIQKGVNVLHRCDVKRCVRPDHLYLGSQVENGLDAIERGQHVPVVGQANGRSKLRSYQVTEIRQAHSALIQGLASTYGVNRDTIRAVCCTNRTWQHHM